MRGTFSRCSSFSSRCSRTSAAVHTAVEAAVETAVDAAIQTPIKATVGAVGAEYPALTTVVGAAVMQQ